MITAQEILNKLNKKKSNLPVSNIKNIQVWIDSCGKLGNRHIIIQGWAFHPDIEDISFDITFNEEHEEFENLNCQNIEFEVIRSTRLDVNKHFSYSDNRKRWGFAIVANWSFEFEPSPDKLKVVIYSDDSNKTVPLLPFVPIAGETLFGHCITWRSEERLKLMSVLHSMVGDKVFELPGLKVADAHVLRERIEWNLDNVLAIPGHGVFISGWLLDPEQTLAGIFVRSQDASYSENLVFKSARYPRQDVIDAFPGKAQSSYQAGLFAWIEMPHLIEHSSLEMVFVTKLGVITIIKIKQSNVRDDITLPSQQVLVNFHVGRPDYQEVMTTHIGPALTALWDNRKQLLGTPMVEVHQFGKTITNPKRSIIVPLYGRYDFLLHQVVQFTKDPDFDKTELIYVLDDPKLYSQFIPFCHDTSKLFPVSFKVIYGGRNLGYAGANNLGTQYATTDQLVLLNSDIIPSQPGWLSRIENAQHKLKDLGVVAPKLVFDDGSIQHLGMSFVKAPEFGDLWLNQHPGKGTPEWLADVKTEMESPAVTGACMFISKSLYLKVGGLDETYVLGDFEDSDLCLKLRSMGYKHYVLGNEKLYHLERQSQDLFENRDWKFKITLYNAWQHTQRWGKLIEELVA
ncbi:glycosyltransferase family 2 protein [Shewanella sp. JM162201]|uniref:Glycosyltransferase family 2 protein n=1 Tax=Shewanella jiangmenensis TaxID=2837387 RepID=A0ABS5V4I1_9GAMM|nr:glycosyltransferase family 2 protein [Shewanella jiangmenensis]MBT1445350.1 glycosyltransferase family 2 protein [Shewanella jiangmenensis]